MSPQESCNFVQNSDLQRISWKKSAPLQLYIHESVPVEAYPAIQRAADEYSRALNRPLIQIAAWGSYGAPSPRKDGFSVLYWLNQWESDRSREQARTTIYWAGNTIYESDIKINAANFKFHFAADEPTADLDLLSLLIHEFGHALGRGHHSSPQSSMHFALADGQRRTLDELDITSLGCEY
jgi:hypothetical protein